MNKRNKILVGCLSLLLVLSVGYALFSETITINGTATAKGSFDITATCEKGFNNDLLTSAFGMTQSEIGEGGYDAANDSCTVLGSTVTINTGLQYPSSKRYYTIKMENTGTMDAYVKSADADYNVIDVSENIKVYSSSTNTLVKEINEKGTTQSGEVMNYARTSVLAATVKDVNGNFMLDDDIYQDNNMLYLDGKGSSYLKIAPGQTLYFIAYIYWPEEATTQGVYSVNTSQISFDFVQQTSDFVESEDAYTCFGGC